MFLVLLTYKKSLADIEKALADHVVFLDKYYENKKLIFSGRRNPRTGGIILVNSDNKEEVVKIMQQDPFYQQGLADYEFIEFTPTKCDEGFRQFLT